MSNQIACLEVSSYCLLSLQLSVTMHTMMYHLLCFPTDEYTYTYKGNTLEITILNLATGLIV